MQKKLFSVAFNCDHGYPFLTENTHCSESLFPTFRRLKASKMFANSENTVIFIKALCFNIPDHLTNTKGGYFNIPVNSLNRGKRYKEAQGQTEDSREGFQCVGSCA